MKKRRRVRLEIANVAGDALSHSPGALPCRPQHLTVTAPKCAYRRTPPRHCAVATVIMGILVLAGCQRFAANQSSVTQPPDNLPRVRVEQYVLPNGLRVVLHEDRSAPAVVVNVIYHVGVRHEKPGRTGMAHLAEHLMFQGSQNNDTDYIDAILRLGGECGGGTGQDSTIYHQLVPRQALERVLWMEADRMGFLVPALTEKKFETQRNVIRAENRQGIDNDPYGPVSLEAAPAFYPPEHPYSWTIVGRPGEFDAITLEDIKDFFRTWYTPNNAVLCIVGDFETAEAKRLVEKYFADIPAGPRPPRVTAWPVVFTGEKRLAVYVRAETPRLYLAWHTVEAYHPDQAALDILHRVLSARLKSALVGEKKIAKDVGVKVENEELAGNFLIQSSPKPRHTLDQIRKIIDNEIAKLKACPPTEAEMRDAKKGIKDWFNSQFKSIQGKASMFGNYALFRGRPDYAEQDLRRFLQVTPRDVQRVAAAYLTTNRLVITAEHDPALCSPKTADKPSLDRRQEPPIVVPLPSQLTAPKAQRFSLANDLEVMLVEYREPLPKESSADEPPPVHFNLVIKSGSSQNPAEKPGLASMTAALARRGTMRRDKKQLDEELKKLGIGLSIGAGWVSTDVNMHTPIKHLDKALEIFADVLLHPAFPQKELDEERKVRMTGISEQPRSPEKILWKAFALTLLGPEHPCAWEAGGTEESLPKITRDDLVKFHSTHYRPNNATLVVVGDVKAGTLRPKLEKALAEWKPAEIPKSVLPQPPAASRRLVMVTNKPGATQTFVLIGAVGPPRNSDDYYPLMLANRMLAGTYSGRLNANLRQDKGYTYAAGSWLDFRDGCSLFAAITWVQKEATKPAIVEMLKEFEGLAGKRPATEAELSAAKDTWVQPLLRSGPQSPGQIAAELAATVRDGLPEDDRGRLLDRIRAVTTDDVQRVAKKYLAPERLTVFVMGDLEVLEPSLRELNLGELRYLDKRGVPVEPQRK